MMHKLRNMIPQLFHAHRGLVLYGIIGISGALIDFVAYVVLYRIAHIPPGLASFLSVSLGIINNFFLNRAFNFKVSDKLFFRFLNFYSIGLGGAILSAGLIVLLYNIFMVNPIIAKLATVIPVVLLQYLLNKKFSFQAMHEGIFSGLWRASIRNRLLLFLNLFFIICTLFLVKQIPINESQLHYSGSPQAQPIDAKGGPDEMRHFAYNVNFILTHHSLPVSGKDDLSAYHDCRRNNFGKVPCMYSYVAYPGASYIANAFTASVANQLFHVSYEKGSRLASVVWGVVFLNAIFLLAFYLTRSRHISLALAFSVSFIPQVVFTFSYTNQDAHSLAIAAATLASLAAFILTPSMTRIIVFSILFGGFLPLAKYNYFILFPFIALVLCYFWLKGNINRRHVLRVIVGTVISFLAIASFWYARNFLLYHDFLGQNFVLKKMLDFAPAGTPHPLSLHTLVLFSQLNFFTTLFQSFFMAYGYMLYYLPSESYTVVQAAILGAACIYIYLAAISAPKERARLYIILGTLALVILGAVVLVFYNSAINDFQPQGRYLFTVLPCIAGLLALAYQLDKRMRYVVLVLVFITLFVDYGALDLIVRNYVII